MKKLAFAIAEKRKKLFLKDLDCICAVGHVLRGFGGSLGFDMAVMATKVRATGTKIWSLKD